jgi:hypothetical protein
MRNISIGHWVLRTLLALAFGSILGATEVKAADKLLAETVDFTRTFVFLETKAPGVVIGVIRNGETVVRGYGDMADGSGKAPGRRLAHARGIDHQGLLPAPRSHRWWAPASSGVGGGGLGEHRVERGGVL